MMTLKLHLHTINVLFTAMEAENRSLEMHYLLVRTRKNGNPTTLYFGCLEDKIRHHQFLAYPGLKRNCLCMDFPLCPCICMRKNAVQRRRHFLDSTKVFL